MPRIVPREAAVAEIVAARNGAPCLVCALLEDAGGAGRACVVAESAHSVVVITRYAVRFGHALVLLRDHATRFEAVDAAAWADAAEASRRTAVAIERVLAPARCYVASLGTDVDDVPMSSPHLHLHVIPIFDKGERPSAVLSWAGGVTIASDEERAELALRLRAAW